MDMVVAVRPAMALVSMVRVTSVNWFRFSQVTVRPVSALVSMVKSTRFLIFSCASVLGGLGWNRLLGMVVKPSLLSLRQCSPPERCE